MPDLHPAEAARPPLIQFRNCRILWKHKIIREDLWVRNGQICNPEKLFFDEKVSADIQVDCLNAIIAPGLIDVQINGAFGVDFSGSTENITDGINTVAKGLLAHGVTSFCPTLVTSTIGTYKKVLPQVQCKAGSKDGAGVLGLHLEGPFINKEKKGAHPVDLIIPLEKGFQSIVDVYGSLAKVSLVTLAPELPDALDVIKELTNRGIIVSAGHSMANLSQGEEAVQSGVSFITHLFNAMLPFHHRDPHLVGLLASENIPKGKTIYYGMISDGIHTAPAALRIAHRTHPKGIVLVTDAIPAMGLSTGHHQIGDQLIEIKNGRATIAGTDTLCGSIASLIQCVQFFYQSTECTREEALEAASLNPALMLGISEHKGTLDYGSDADFILLDNDLNVLYSFIAGEQVFQAENATELRSTNCTDKKT